MNRPSHEAEPVFLGIECGGTRNAALLACGPECRRMEAGGANLCLIADAHMLRMFRQVSPREPRFFPPICHRPAEELA